MNTDDKKAHTDDFDGFFTQAQREMEAGLPKEITETYNVISSISETNLRSSASPGSSEQERARSQAAFSGIA